MVPAGKLEILELAAPMMLLSLRTFKAAYISKRYTGIKTNWASSCVLNSFILSAICGMIIPANHIGEKANRNSRITNLAMNAAAAKRKLKAAVIIMTMPTIPTTMIVKESPSLVPIPLVLVLKLVWIFRLFMKI